MVNKVLIRSDTNIRWSASNPVLSLGELAIESDTQNLKLGDGANTWNNLDYYITRPALKHPISPEGAVRLDLHGSLLNLEPYMGDILYCNGTPEILNIGYTLDTTGLVANTTYYIYATLVSGNGWVLSANLDGFVMSRGIAVCASNSSLTLVGMARTNASNQWEDSLSNRFVISWYNKRVKKAQVKLPASITSNSIAWAELTGQYRIELLSWSDYDAGDVSASIMGTGTTANIATNIYTGILFDGAIMYGATAGSPRTATTGMCQIIAYSTIPILSEGYHYVGIAGKISGTVALATWIGGFGQYEGVIIEATTIG